MYKVSFYYSENEKSDIIDYLENLRIKSLKSKEARILRTKILAYIHSLELFGTRIGEPTLKHIDGIYGN